MKIGAQLYTVRDKTQNLKDFAETLKKVADIGYETVQVSATCPFEPEWLRDRLSETGLTCALTHADRELVKADPIKVAGNHEIFGCKYVGLGNMPQKDNTFITDEDYDAFVKEYLPAAKKIAEQGKYLMFHNHHREFAKSGTGEIYLKRLMKDFPADLMGFTLDVYWVQVGGGDIIDWLDRLHGRVPCVHLKDLTIEKQQPKMMPVGQGNINMEAVVRACLDSGTEYLLVEQDECNGEDPFECLKTSYKYLKGLGL